MSKFIVIVIVLVFLAGIFIGFAAGFSRAMREAAKYNRSAIRSFIAWGLISVGCLVLGGAIIAFLDTRNFTRIAERATGTVIEMVAGTGHDGLDYAPIFRFQDASGRRHTVTSNLYSSPPDFHVGESVKILYSPDDPEHARIDTFFQVWGLPMMLGIFCSFQLSFGLALLFWPAILARFGIAQSVR